MTKPKRRRLYPMPVESLFDSPTWIAAPVALRGIVVSLCEHFWRTECAPLPKDADQLFAIARAHRPTWSRHKLAALALFEAVRPDLEAYKRHRDTRAHVIDLVSRKGGAATRAKARQKALQASPPAPAITLATPQREAAHGPPQRQQTPLKGEPKPRFAQRTR